MYIKRTLLAPQHDWCFKLPSSQTHTTLKIFNVCASTQRLFCRLGQRNDDKCVTADNALRDAITSAARAFSGGGPPVPASRLRGGGLKEAIQGARADLL
ncbi:hypothetical protein EVAR_79977_1 [Eumeta japonica]|uniref:Uncharacterized protein n=1 Tax=Eumeta variegata TaxID=151549 RepID=A0A4C2AAX2_EUMVA|nr:hypothetical protein EVAR_79977_1 [Eumeta japonica]